MSTPPTLITVTPELSEGIKWFATQQWVKQAVINAGIGYAPGGYLLDIDPTDSEGIKWAKLNAWLALLATNISGGGGGGSYVPPGIVIVTGASTLAANKMTIVNSGSASNQALPSAPTVGQVCIVKNIGAGIVTVTAGSAIIFGASAVSTYQVGGVGAASTFTWDGTYWEVT